VSLHKLSQEDRECDRICDNGFVKRYTIGAMLVLGGLGPILFFAWQGGGLAAPPVLETRAMSVY
jgi:hypothetical protein